MSKYRPLSETTLEEIEDYLKSKENHKDTNQREDDRHILDILLSGANKMPDVPIMEKK